MYEIVDIAQLESVNGGFVAYVPQISIDINCYMDIGIHLVAATFIPAVVVSGITGSGFFGFCAGLSIFPFAATLINENFDRIGHCGYEPGYYDIILT